MGEAAKWFCLSEFFPTSFSYWTLEVAMLPEDTCGERKPDGSARGLGGLFQNSSPRESTWSCRPPPKGLTAHLTLSLILQMPGEGLA